MPILKNLIIKEWLKFFLGSLLALILLITVAELITGFLRSNVTPLEVILNHLMKIMDKFKLIFPVSCLIASLFSINKLKNKNELTAIFASGYSRKKFIIDITQISLFIALFQILISGFIAPYATGKKDYLIKDGQSKFRNLKSKGLMASTIGSGKMWYKGRHYFFSFSTFNTVKKSLSHVSIYYFKNSKIYKKINSPLLFYKEKKWLAPKLTEISNLDNISSPQVDKKRDQVIHINETPEDFAEIKADITTLNMIKLYHYIMKLRHTGINVDDYTVMLLEKISTSLMCILFALIASTGIFTPNRRGSSLIRNIFTVFAFVILYWLINSYFIELGKSSKLPPLLACFSVPFIFSLYLGTIFLKNRRLR